MGNSMLSKLGCCIFGMQKDQLSLNKKKNFKKKEPFKMIIVKWNNKVGMHEMLMIIKMTQILYEIIKKYSLRTNFLA